MEQKSTADRVLKQYACTISELTCIIGSLFTELNPPCGKCRANNITISGTTYTGEAATLVIVKDGFLFDGSPETIAKIRERRCIWNG